MPVSIRVIDGTRPGDGKNLCESCHYGQFARGEGASEVHFDCQHFAKAPNFRKVTECTGYKNRNTPSLNDMRDIAWVLVTDRNRQKIGFQQAREWKKEHLRENLIPDDDY